jgi:hypothetical protein
VLVLSPLIAVHDRKWNKIAVSGQVAVQACSQALVNSRTYPLELLSGE